MAKTEQTTAEMKPAPAPQRQIVALARDNGKQPPEQPTALQRGADSFMSMAEILAGGEPEPEKKPDKKEAEATPAAKETPAKPDPKKADAPVAKASEEETTGDKPILGDDDADGEHDDEDEDGAEGGKDDSASLQAKLFKQREKRRAAEKQRDEVAAEKAKLQKENEELRTKTTTGDAPGLGGYFANAKTDADIDALEAKWTNYADYLDDNKDGFIAQDGTDWTAEDVKAERRAVRDAFKQIPAARKLLAEQTAKQTTATEKATKLYPFVLDSGKKHHDVALSLAQEFPELKHSPNRSLLLGMLTVARGVELGDFTVVPKVKGKATVPAAEAVKEPAARAPSSMPSPAPAPARAVQQTVPDTSTHTHARMIAGDMEAAADWAMGLLGDD